MFYHAFNGYMEHAFPLDELRPQSCGGEDSLGGYALTLVIQITNSFLKFFIQQVNFFLLSVLMFEICVFVKLLCDVFAMSLSQIDSLDTLALLGDRDRFAASVEWIGKNLQFDIVSSVFHSFFFSL